jgi:hypothetical protein
MKTASRYYSRSEVMYFTCQKSLITICGFTNEKMLKAIAWQKRCLCAEAKNHAGFNSIIISWT